MAYILGFITADGSVTDRHLKIEINKLDYKLLEFIKQELFSNAPIKETRNKYALLRICSVNLIKSLNKFGVVANKTKKFTHFTFDIPDEYFGDYLRGFFDGDGWVYCRNNSIESGLCAYNFGILDYLRRKAGNIGHIRKRIRKLKSGAISHLHSWDMKKGDTLKLRALMYNSNGFSLERKRNIMFSDFYKPSPKYWTNDDILILIQEYKPNVEGMHMYLAKKLNRSYKAISKKIWELKLKTIQ